MAAQMFEFADEGFCLAQVPLQRRISLRDHRNVFEVALSEDLFDRPCFNLIVQRAKGSIG